MKRLFVLMLVVMLVSILSACTSTEVSQAEAERIRAMTHITQTAAARGFEVEATAASVRSTQQAVLQESVVSAKDTIRTGTQVFLWIGIIVGSITLVALVWYGLKTASGVSTAAVYSATSLAHQIKLDPDTGSYPLLDRDGHLHNPNTGHVMAFGQPRCPYPKLVQGEAYVRAANVFAHAATKAATSPLTHGGSHEVMETLPGIASGIPQLYGGEDEDFLTDTIGDEDG